MSAVEYTKSQNQDLTWGQPNLNENGFLHSKNIWECSQVPNLHSHALQSYNCMCFHASRAYVVRQQFLNFLVLNLHNFYERGPLPKLSRTLFHLRTDRVGFCRRFLCQITWFGDSFSFPKSKILYWLVTRRRNLASTLQVRLSCCLRQILV